MWNQLIPEATNSAAQILTTEKVRALAQAAVLEVRG